MAVVELYRSTLDSVLRAVWQLPSLDGPRVVPYRHIPVIFQLTVDDGIDRVIRERPILHTQLREILSREILSIARVRIVPLTTILGNVDYVRLQTGTIFRNEAQRLQGLLVAPIEAAMKSSDHWAAYKTDSKKEVARVGLTLAFVAAAAAAVPPTVGVSIALLIVSLVRGLTDATKKFTEAYRTAEESRERALKEIAQLSATYRKYGTGMGRASQVGGAMAHALTVGKIATIFRSDPVPGFTRIKTEVSAYKGKIGHLGTFAEMLARRLYQLLDLIDEYGTTHGPIPAELEKLQDGVATLLAGGVTGRRHGFRGAMTITSAWERSQAGTAALVDVEHRFAELKKLEQHPKSVVVADRIVTLLTNLEVALAGYNGPMSLGADPSQTQIRTSLRVIQGGHASPGGISALMFGFGRQFMSLFKDSHSLAKDLGVVGASSAAATQLYGEVRSEFLAIPVQAHTPRLPDLDLPGTLGLPFE